MATTAIPVQTLSTGYSTTGDLITFTAADVANGNHSDWPNASSELVLVARNVHAVTAYTVSITSVADATTGRTGNVTALSIAAGAQVHFPLSMLGWKNTSSQVVYSGSNASIQFAPLAT